MEPKEVKKGKTIFSFYKRKEPEATTSHHSPFNIDQGSSKLPRVEVEVPRVEIEVPRVEVEVPRVEVEVPRVEVEADVDDISLPRDPAERIPISQYPINQRDEIRRSYIKLGPFQPRLSAYKATFDGTQNRSFQSRWFDQFPWIEYSQIKDAVFCFPCFLFENKNARFAAFTIDGFRSWKRVCDGSRGAFLQHAGGTNSPHNNSVKSMGDLMNVTRHIDKVIDVHSSEKIEKNRLRLKVTIECVRWLTFQGCAFRGHDESNSSINQGNFMEMVDLLGRMNFDMGLVIKKAPKNAKYTSPKIQKEVLHILAEKVRRKIREEVGNAKYCILVDEAKDISSKEQMAIVLRFVDAKGVIRERFFDIVHVTDTTAATLKKEITQVLDKYDLPICNMRGQGYDGASNMRGAWNGLQALFLGDCTLKGS